MRKPQQTEFTSAHYTGIPGTNAAVNVSWDAADWVQSLRYLRTNIPPHTIFQYSNINCAIATRVVEVVTGRSFYDVSKELVFDPLGLDAVWDAREAEHKSQGFYRTGLNWTACVADSVSGPEGSLTATDIPPSCLGTFETVEFWTNGSGREWAGGGAALLTGKDMVCAVVALASVLTAVEMDEGPPHP
jgi:CubicO group peptidase (beta-lactamase class C family)